jgi:hypothetical protein
VQNAKGTVFSRWSILLAAFLRVPSGTRLRLPAGKVDLPSELGFRQIQVLFVVHSKDTEANIKRMDRNEAGSWAEASMRAIGDRGNFVALVSTGERCHGRAVGSRRIL